jgi:NAD(P)-dependent dehydrogenase (short-subunit alcohol dehydrogenase family)
MVSLSGSTVFVTGANGGIGTQLVLRALARGATRVYASARQPREWEDSRIVPFLLDVEDSKSVTEAARVASDTSILINNAGISDITPLLEVDMDTVRRVFEVNVFAPLELARAFAPVLAAQGGGAVIDIHSGRSWISGLGAYSASKAAFWGLTNSLRLEFASQGTQVLGAHFGFVDTPMTKAFTGENKADPADIANLIYDALERDEIEVVADELSKSFRDLLARPLIEQYPQLSALQAELSGATTGTEPDEDPRQGISTRRAR